MDKQLQKNLDPILTNAENLIETDGMKGILSDEFESYLQQAKKECLLHKEKERKN